MCSYQTNKSPSESAEQSSLRTNFGNLPNESDAETPAPESDTFLFGPAVMPKTEEALRLVNALIKFAAYDVVNGGFIIHSARKGSRNKEIGDYLGTLTDHGYLRVSLRDRLYYIHQLVWLWFNGEVPLERIDHKDGLMTNNRIENLRMGNSLNQRNSKMFCTNTSGFAGVSLCKESNKWRSRITINDKELYFGLYATPEAAAQARQDYINSHPELGFTERHGK